MGVAGLAETTVESKMSSDGVMPRSSVCVGDSSSLAAEMMGMVNSKEYR